MTIGGPRPALWNQDDLIAERDKYGANSVIPGLTGWAQINGRDELEIPVKAKFDGEYVKQLGLGMDIKCFLGTVGSVLSHDGVVEGGTGEMNKNGEENDGTLGISKVKRNIYVGASVIAAVGTIAVGLLTVTIKFVFKKSDIEQQKKKQCKKGIFAIIGGFLCGIGVLYQRSKYRSKTYKSSCKAVTESSKLMQPDLKDVKSKKILITGANSYIGMSVEEWLRKASEKYVIDTIDMIGKEWKNVDFSNYDVVYHVAGIAHADVGNVTEEQKKLYYKVNTDLAFEVAQKAKEDGVKQFIFMSSMIVYSGCDTTMISKDTEPKPLNFYGDSKWQADQKVRTLSDEQFKVVVIRPPMIYGKGSKGNYPELAKLATKLPVFPEVKNKRSMLYIDNLCEFVKLMIDNEEQGIFFPQNGEYTNTSEMVQMIAAVKGHNIVMIPGMSLPVKIMKKIPGKIGRLTTKAFGNSTYDMNMSEYKEIYRVRTLIESISLTEKKDFKEEEKVKSTMINVFIIGLRGYTQNYGGWEAFAHGLLDNWSDRSVHFYAFEKVTSEKEEGVVDVNGVTCIRVCEKEQGSSAMMKYDKNCTDYAIKYIKKNNVSNPILFHLGVRIGPYIWLKRKSIKKEGIWMIENPAGAEWRRRKWGKALQVYLYISAMMMAKSTDCMVCDNEGIQELYKGMIKGRKPVLDCIAYGVNPALPVTEPIPANVKEFFKKWGIEKDNYYLVLGRYIPENNYELMIKGFMKSNTTRKLLIITNYKTEIQKFHKHILDSTHYPDDPRVIMAGTLYDQETLHYIRQYAHGYIHGHSVGGTNPGLLEAMAETDMNLLYDVTFNRYVGAETALYFEDEDSLKRLIERVDKMSKEEVKAYGDAAKKRMVDKYSWEKIALGYSRVFHDLVEGKNA